MSERQRRRLCWLLLGLLALLHQDFWLRSVSRPLLGLPASLAYHVGYCLVAAALLALAVRWAWPKGLE
ncbi:MAG TPA: DUF3311 domain-containing protein [Thermoanaerobaculia bacterium]|nr:DUF3311 domain-containing protein [Thermoanaerobaculia bacterium]